MPFIVKCDECKVKIKETENLIESFQGGLCPSCRKGTIIKKITKFKSRNLLGENLKEENRRLLKQRIRGVLSGKSRAEIKEIRRGGSGFLKGTSSFQRKIRKRLLKGVMIR